MGGEWAVPVVENTVAGTGVYHILFYTAYLEVYHGAPCQRGSNRVEQRGTVAPTTGEVNGLEPIGEVVSLGVV